MKCFTCSSSRSYLINLSTAALKALNGTMPVDHKILGAKAYYILACLIQFFGINLNKKAVNVEAEIDPYSTSWYSVQISPLDNFALV